MLIEPYVNKALRNQYKLISILAKKKLDIGRPSGGLVIGIELSHTDKVKILIESDYYIFLEFTRNQLSFLIIFCYISPDKSFPKKIKRVYEELAHFTPFYDKVITMAMQMVGLVNLIPYMFIQEKAQTSA